MISKMAPNLILSTSVIALSGLIAQPSLGTPAIEKNNQEQSKKQLDQKKTIPFSLKLNPTDERLKQDGAHLVITDAELSQENLKIHLEAILKVSPNLPVNLEIGNAFVNKGGALTLSAKQIPSNLTHLTITNTANTIKSIGDDFLFNAGTLKSVSLKLPNITSIGKRFLAGAGSLTSFDTREIATVTSIGPEFLSGTGSLKSIDTRGLAKLKSIPNYFLSDTWSLSTFDTSSLTKVRTIGNSFLSGSSNLLKINTSGLVEVRSIGNDFLSGAESLINFDTSSLSKLTTIGDDFLSYAEILADLNTKNLPNLISVGESFLSGALSLKKFDARPLTSLTSVGKDIFFDAGLLEAIYATEAQKALIEPNLSGLHKKQVTWHISK